MVTLDSRMNAQNAGIVMAEDRGYFDDAGLPIWIGSPGDPKSPVEYVVTGRLEMGVTQEPEVVLAQERGEPLVAVGSLVSGATAAMIWLKGSGIEDLSDLEGKTIAIPGVPFQREFLEAALANADIDAEDVQIVSAGYETVQKLLDGEVDAIFGNAGNIEGQTLEARGAEPVITPVQDLGIPPYDEAVVIARPECIKQHPRMIRRFMSGVARGTAMVLKSPKGTSRLLEESPESDPEVTPAETRAQVEATLPSLSRDGYIDPSQAADLIEWMHQEGMIQEEPQVADLFTNDYLAR